MEIVYKIDRGDLDVMHDILSEINGEEYTDEHCQLAYGALPKEIMAIALQWGTNDTVFRDHAYVYLRDLGKQS